MTLTVELALIVGVLFLLLGVLRLGFISEFLARPVISGFLFGLSLVIAIGQAPKLFGLPAGQGNFFQKAWQLITHLGNTNGWTLLVGVASLALLFGLKQFAPKLPAFLVTVVFGILMVSVLGLEQRGVAIVGPIPGGIPLPKMPSIRLDDFVVLLPGALGILFVGFAEHISAVRGFATSHHYDIDPDQEFIALGVSNLAAGLFGGLALSGGLSQSTVNDRAGARSQMFGIVAAVLLLLTAVLLTPLFHDLPQATLGAIVIYAVSRSWKLDQLQRYFRLSRMEFAAMLTALLGELVLNVLDGLLVAVVLSLLLLIYRASKLHISVLGKVPGRQAYSNIEQHPENETVPGLLILRSDQPIFFANNTVLRNRIRELIRTTDPRCRAVLLSLESSGELGVTSADVLAELAAELKGGGTQLLLARAHAPVRDMLQRSGAAEVIGKEHIYLTVDEGVQDFRSRIASEG